MSQMVRSIAFILAALGVQSASMASATDEPGPSLTSELITPKGWERRVAERVTCDWLGDLLSSAEIIVPAGWTDTRHTEPRWGGHVCSELVVPAAWERTPTTASSR